MERTQSIIIGIITGGVTAWVLQAAAVLVFAILGAFGGWIFSEYIKPAIKPKFDKYFKKKR